MKTELTEDVMGTGGDLCPGLGQMLLWIVFRGICYCGVWLCHDGQIEINEVSSCGNCVQGCCVFARCLKVKLHPGFYIIIQIARGDRSGY